MSALLLVRLGRGEYAEGSRTMYAVLDEERVADVISASNDDEALARARTLSGERGVACEAALGAVARRRQAAVRPLSAFEKMIKAHVASPLFEPESYRNQLDGGALMDFFEAAHVFSRAVAADTRPQWHVAATLRGAIAEREINDSLFFLVVPGPEPQLYVLTRARARWVFDNDAQVTDVDRTVVKFRREGTELAPLLDDAYGLVAVPHIEVVADGKSAKPDSIVLEYLAACLGAIGRHVAAGAPGIIYAPLLGGELEVTLSTFQRSGS